MQNTWGRRVRLAALAIGILMVVLGMSAGCGHSANALSSTGAGGPKSLAGDPSRAPESVRQAVEQIQKNGARTASPAPGETRK